MVGTFAPVHEGHFDAMRSAERALAARGEDASAVIFAPNSDSYVSVKLEDTDGTWNITNRIAEFLSRDAGTCSQAYVDDISGLKPPERSISKTVTDNVHKQLGITAFNSILVVGSDQIASVRPHLDNNRAICILRPGYADLVNKHFEEDWFLESVKSGRYILAERENSEVDVNSTCIRALLKRTRERLLS
jgi:nicotinic acid mononucleotide adenylyltransferase